MFQALLISALGLLACPTLLPEAPSQALSSLFDDEPIEIDLFELTSIDWKPGAKIPKKILELDGKKVVIKGLMAMGTLQGVDSFQLVTDGCSCGTTRVHHFVQVSLGESVTDYTPDEIQVTGTFSVGEIVEDGFVTSLYRLTDAAIE